MWFSTEAQLAMLFKWLEVACGRVRLDALCDHVVRTDTVEAMEWTRAERSNSDMTELHDWEACTAGYRFVSLVSSHTHATRAQTRQRHMKHMQD